MPKLQPEEDEEEAKIYNRNFHHSSSSPKLDTFAIEIFYFSKFFVVEFEKDLL